VTTQRDQASGDAAPDGVEHTIQIRLFLNGYTRQLAPSLAVLGWIGQVQPTFMPLMDESVRMVGPAG